MGWRERLRPAKFKEVPFYVDGSAFTQGRRVQVRRFAGRDGSAQQDLGLDPVELDVSAYLFGEDYDRARDELERAIVEGGPGWLCIPTRGNLWVRITRGPQTSETREEGGFCTIRFGAVLEERELPRTLRARVDAPAALSASASAAASTARAQFVRDFDTEALPSGYVARTRSTLDRAMTLAGRVQARTSSLMAPLAEASRTLDAMRERAVSLLSLPSLLATHVVDVVNSAFSLNDAVIAGVDLASGTPYVLTTPFARGRGARMLDAIAAAFRGFGEPWTSRGESALAARDDANVRALNVLVRSSALSAQASAFAKVAFDSSSFVRSALERTLDELDAVQALADDALFSALTDLRAALVRFMIETAARLPDTRTYVPKEPTPALLVSFALYGRLDMESDVIARNRLSDPLRARGTLEVIAP